MRSSRCEDEPQERSSGVSREGPSTHEREAARAAANRGAAEQ
jgi:hypothetical protein